LKLVKPFWQNYNTSKERSKLKLLKR
jgi:hypothetical protein